MVETRGDERLVLASADGSALMLVDRFGVVWIPFSATKAMAITRTAAQATISKMFFFPSTWCA